MTKSQTNLYENTEKRPEEIITSLIQKVVKQDYLEKIFSELFPEENLKEWLNYDPNIRQKHVQGIGKFLFYSSPGDMRFHEKLLDIVLAELRRKKKHFKRGEKKKGADFFIFEKSKKIYCELETGLLKRSEYRPNLENRIIRYPNRCIILVCNQSDKKKYVTSNLRYLQDREPIIITIAEFLGKQNNFF